jgi:hypothetical protein
MPKSDSSLGGFRKPFDLSACLSDRPGVRGARMAPMTDPKPVESWLGDRMDTDVVSGLEAGMCTILVLTGSTNAEDVERFPYRPIRVANSIAEVVELVSELAPSAAVA